MRYRRPGTTSAEALGDYRKSLTIKLLKKGLHLTFFSTFKFWPVLQAYRFT